MTVADVTSGSLFDSLRLGTGDGDDEIVVREVEMRKISLAKRAEKAAEAHGKKLEPANLDVSIFEPVDFFRVVLRSINRGGREHVREGFEDAFGAADISKPVADKGDVWS